MGALLPEYDPVNKISIVPRGGSGGATFFAPSEEQLESGLYSRAYLCNRMAVLLAGRVAEEVVMGPEDVTTGASDDFRKVSEVARSMVAQLGFSARLGQVAWSQPGGGPFLGAEAAQPAECSAETSRLIDEEVRALVDQAYRRAKDLIQSNLPVLHRIAAVLVDREQMSGEELQVRGGAVWGAK